MTPNWDAILDAGDYVKTTLTEEAITEPHAPGGTKRALTIEHKSVTVGFKVTETCNYLNFPDSKAWAGESGRDYVEEAL